MKFSALEWAKDGSGFYYSRFPEPKAGQTFQQLNENHSIYFHKLGTPQAEDRLVFATPARPDLNNVGVVSDDGKWLITYSSSGTDDRYEISLVDLKKPGAKPRVLIPGFNYNYSYIGNRGSTFYFQTNEGAPKLKVVALDIAQASAQTEDDYRRGCRDARWRQHGRRQAGRAISGRRQDRGPRPWARRQTASEDRASRDRHRVGVRRRV